MTSWLLPLLSLGGVLMVILKLSRVHGGQNANVAEPAPQKARPEDQLLDTLTVDGQIAEFERDFASSGDVPDRRPDGRGNPA